MTTSWKDWLAEQRAASQMTTEEIPLKDAAPWGFQDDGARFGRPDGKFFDLVGVKISVPKGREVTSWSQPMLREVGEGAVVLAKAAGEERFLLQARPEPGTDALGCVTLTATLQASRSNLEAAHGGARPSRAELYDALASKASAVEDGGRFFRERNLYGIAEVDPAIELRPNERWFLREELREAYAAGDLGDHLMKCLLGAVL